MKPTIFFLLFIALTTAGYSQSDSTNQTWPEYKNTIRYAVTPTLIFGTGTWVFGYERLLDKHKSMSINVGHIQMPRFFENTLDTFQIKNDARRNGFTFAADYGEIAQMVRAHDS